MNFADKFSKVLSEDINNLRTSFKKGGSNKRHHNAKTGQKRLHQNFIPVVHQANANDNAAIEHIRDRQSGQHVCSPQDLVHIINTYIKQGDQEPCNISNVQQMAQKYLQPKKQLGTTGMRVVFNPTNKSYILLK